MNRIPLARLVMATTALLLSGCAAAQPHVEATSDAMTGNSVVETTQNRLGGCPELVSINLNAGRIVTANHETRYGFHLFYEAPHWAFIQPGASLLMLIDGQRVQFVTRNPPSRQVLAAYLLRENAYYTATLADIERVANAKDVQVRVVGSEAQFDLHFTPKNFAVLQNFVHTVKTGAIAR